MAITPYELRHILHKNPELSFKEFETTRFLINAIKELDRDLKLKIYTPFKTGLLVEYAPNDKNDFLLFRADIDALPIKEENEVDFKSCNNFMHACGHDVHTSILYNFISIVLKERINKNILFLFQPAEESGGGAIEFFNTGIFNNFKIRNAFALHVTDEYSEGTIASSKGVLFSSTLEVDIDFIGISSHVAFPFKGKNAFNALRLFLDSVEKIPKDFTEPFIFGVGKIKAGEVRNINPGNAHLEGTARGLSIKKTELFFEQLLTVSQGIEKITGVNIKLTKGAVYPEVIVNDELYDKLFPVLSKKINFIDCGYKMTGEDFGFFSHKFPSFMFWLGTSKGENHGLHNPKFLPDDKIIDVGTSIFMSILETL